MHAVIRDAGQADLEALVTLNAEVQQLHVNYRPDTFRPMDIEEIAARFRQLFQDPPAKVWLAITDNVACGYLVSIERTQAPSPFVLNRTWLELDQIGVQAGRRRTGVARSLIEHAVAHAQTRGIAHVELNSWSFNQDAQRAFQKLGFTPKSVRFELSRSR